MARFVAYMHGDHVAFYVRETVRAGDPARSEDVRMPDGSRPSPGSEARCGTCGAEAPGVMVADGHATVWNPSSQFLDRSRVVEFD